MVVISHFLQNFQLPFTLRSKGLKVGSTHVTFGFGPSLVASPGVRDPSRFLGIHEQCRPRWCRLPGVLLRDADYCQTAGSPRPGDPRLCELLGGPSWVGTSGDIFSAAAKRCCPAWTSSECPFSAASARGSVCGFVTPRGHGELFGWQT